MVDFKKIGQALFRRPADQLLPIEKERLPVAGPAFPVLSETLGEPAPAGQRRGRQQRQRIKAFNIGMTAAEFAQAEALARKAGLSNAAYGRACVLGESGPRAKRAPPVNPPRHQTTRRRGFGFFAAHSARRGDATGRSPLPSCRRPERAAGASSTHTTCDLFRWR